MNAPIRIPTKAAVRRAANAAGITFDALVTYAADADKEPAEWLAPGYQGSHKDGKPELLYPTLVVLFALCWGMPEQERVVLEQWNGWNVVSVPGTPVGCDLGWLVQYELEVERA